MTGVSAKQSMNIGKMQMFIGCFDVPSAVPCYDSLFRFSVTFPEKDSYEGDGDSLTGMKPGNAPPPAP